ncbi:hypothetical protein [Streptomyces europaeiscabiei]|uniref:hypothetical protein n=1 Tax=Streptomyces europaeiscabiei TaxID=146819 RepID=UPI002E27B433|nr:hypothetical protein [Streptomyces europaeiscabiei]
MAVAAALVMGEISQLLETLATKGAFTYSANALTGWPEFPAWDDTDRANAVNAWNDWAEAVPGDAAVRADMLEAWLMTHIVLDIVVFAPAYVIGLYLLLRWLLDLRLRSAQADTSVSPSTQTAIPFSPTGITILLSALLLADWVETGLTCGLIHAGQGDIGAWASGVACLSAVKWALLAVVLLLGAAVFVVDILPRLLPHWLNNWKEGSPEASRTWTRHRVQVIAVAVLAALIILPGGGPLEQVPDIQRAWVTDRVGTSVEAMTGPVLMLVGLCVALWVAGRWALLDGLENARHKAHGTKDFAVLLGVVLIVVCVARLGPFGATSGAKAPALWDEWGHNSGAVAIPSVVAAILILGLVVGNQSPQQRTVQHPNGTRAKVERIGRGLTVVPLVIAGLGLVRAFAMPLLLGSLVDTGVSRTGIVTWFVGGAVLAVLVPPVMFWFLGQVEACMFGTKSAEEDKQRLRRRKWLPNVIGGLLLALAGGLGVFTALAPLTAGAWLRTLGLLSLLLTTVVLLGAFFIRRAEAREPYQAYRVLRFRFTPIWLPVLAVLVTQSMLDNSGLYHAVRLHSKKASAGAAKPFSAQERFQDWYGKASACRHGKKSDAVPESIPMVFIAAAGGGIRAAYWTSAAMDRLTGVSPCVRSYTFAMSGVSGGSLGLAAYTLTNSQPDSPTSSETIRRLAGEEALAANIAALLYRDGTHAFHGLNYIQNQSVEDRAAVFERAWEETWPGKGQGWKQELSSAARQQPGWQPFLLMNGTDVVSGCRIAVAPQRITGVGRADERLRCQQPNIARGGAQFATATVDAAAFNDTATCSDLDRGLRMSTAAHLSARFPYVSPSGTMYGCDKEGEDDPPAISSVDGGYLEGSGMAALLELWSAVEPVVAAKNLAAAEHNERETTKPKEKVPYVVPLVVLLDSHYSVQTPEPEIDPVNELVAPLTGNQARTTAARLATLQQAALVRFSGPLPGTMREAVCPSRSFVVAPRTEPQIAAPLGWVLSAMSIKSMDNQLTGGSTGGKDDDGLVAGQLPDLLRVLKQPVPLEPESAEPRP